MVRVTCRDLRVGQKVWADHQRQFAFNATMRIEAVGEDWAIARDEDGKSWKLEDYDVEEYNLQDLET